MVVEPLPALAVGEEAVARSTLGRALKWGLVMETWNNMMKLPVFLQFIFFSVNRVYIIINKDIMMEKQN